MRSRHLVVDDRGVTDFERTEHDALARATLEIDPSAPAPRGTLTPAEGRRLSFSGWSELAVAVEDFRTGSSHAAAAAMTEKARSSSRREESS
jgi:hypothetical protein